MRLAWIVLLAAIGIVGGCAHGPSRPSTMAERTPTPGSVTRDNPAGDAEAQVDAALTRLLEQPPAFKRDRFRTLNTRLTDHKTWKRVRFWGHPTRAAYRYGKDGYAVAVVAYFDAEGDDSPRSCLERFVRDAQGTAESFDVAVGPRRRELHSHYRGPESVDWVEHERLAKKRRAERQKRMAELRRKAIARLPKIKLRRAQRRAALKRRAQTKRTPHPPPKVVSQPPGSGIKPSAAASSRAAEPKPANSAGQPPPAGSASQPPPVGSASQPPPAGSAKPGIANQPSARQPRKIVMRFNRLRALAKQAKRKETWRRRHRPRRHTPAQRWQWREQRYGKADMPVIRVSAQFDTVLVQDRYLAAVAAYQSWPDTCLVQGFAVRVGSDETVAQKVIDRWVRDLAGKLVWFGNLREAPPFENR
ncbi:MAG: hypothetical protein JRI68_10415 [Deltaproteobacteria bacterium]|nr:hypothetical protein [Deltaproteobacteria bacterium]